MPATQTETCANCGRTIGRLETVELYHGQGVCHGCLTLLHEQEPRSTSARTAHPAGGTASAIGMPQAPARSYTNALFLTIVMYIVGFVVGFSLGGPLGSVLFFLGVLLGLVANLFYLEAASKEKKRIGYNPEGYWGLKVLINTMIILLGVSLVLVLASLMVI